MGETHTFGNNKAKETPSVFGSLVINNKIRTRSIYHPRCKENLGFSIIMSEIMETEMMTGIKGNQ